ncbi:MAG: DNA mismatch repair protein MutS [Flavobacteriaceae bacterium]|nr:DNA mismatch repair protein MutS [Flavobacteriaceae bacterium]
MRQPIQFYKSQIEIYQGKLNAFKSKLLCFSLTRIAVYLLGVFGIYYYFLELEVAIAIAVVSISVFLILLSKHTDAKKQRDLVRAILKINEEEISIASGSFHDRFDGVAYQNPSHFYSLDIDLFGRGSFFQFINRTATTEGTHNLANALKANNVKQIIKRQKAIEELAEKANWRQEYTAKGQLIDEKTASTVIVNWLKNYKIFIPRIMQWFPYVFGTISIAVIVLSILKIAPIAYVVYWLLVGIAIIAIYFSKVSHLAQYSTQVKDTFRQYALLLDQIESETFSSELLKDKQQQITLKGKKSSEIFTAFSKSLDALENRNNMFFIILGNGFLLWDLMQSYKIEQWILEYGEVVEHWFQVVSFFDAYNSLGNFAFNHPAFVYPEINASKAVIDASNLGHPLLDSTKRIDSDLIIENEEFFIVTGANMAGKSTFLRTVSLHIVMANMGLPVCATASKYSPVKLITSMRTTDSLADDSSYFFSELTRLKFIVDQIAEEPYFIILDEILKGTNSTDKAIGSRKFVEKLVAGNATGIIATHDLSLCEIEKELDAVKNYFFDAKIVNDELYFDYKLKQGICQNMNASFLLKKMEII